MRVFITGINGFIGGHLTEQLLSDGGHVVAGISRQSGWSQSLTHLQDQVQLFQAELSETHRLLEVLQQFQADWIFHLAGYANTGKSYHDQDQCWHDNLTACRMFYDTVAKLGHRPKIAFASSGLVYGDPHGALQSLHEGLALNPASPYAVSKAAADLLSYQYTRHPGLNIVRVRLFNQIGPRQSADFAIANFARQIAAIEAKVQEPILQTGDLSAYRDITDVRDMVRAFIMVMKDAPSGEVYNAGRGEVIQIQAVVQELLSLAKCPIQVQSSLQPGRSADTKISQADPTKIKQLTGWVPRYSLKQTLFDTLEYWRSQTNNS